MTNQHPITPPPEQADQWFDDAMRLNSTPKYYIVRQAALWGADQELKACCLWLDKQTLCGHHELIPSLRDARRPKPPILKEQALEALEVIPKLVGFESERDAIRRALEQLNDE